MKRNSYIREQIMMILLMIAFITIDIRVILMLYSNMAGCHFIPLSRENAILFSIVVVAFLVTMLVLFIDLNKAFSNLGKDGHEDMSHEEIRRAARAFTAIAYPVNPIPFARAIASGVRNYGSSWIRSDEAKGVLLTLISMSYGQLFTVDHMQEYKRLESALGAADD